MSIDADGFPSFGETRVTDVEIGHEILKNMKLLPNGAFGTQYQGDEALVEAFDEPFVVQMLDLKKSELHLEMPYSFDLRLPLQSAGFLYLDEWDRMHGRSSEGVPFVLSRKAQAKIFDLADEFDDDSITLSNKKIELTTWLPHAPQVEKADFWTSIYKNEIPRWELQQPSPALVDMLPRLKMPKSRVLVLGGGSGNDAAFFAEHGHHVTCVDFSESAIEQAKKKFSNLKIQWVQSDVFKLRAEQFHQQFDVVFEHTLFCAVNPTKRNELISVWKKCLAPGGQLIAILFCMDRVSAPPFGGSEWEYRERLKKHFQFLFWGRWKNSIADRNGKELFILAQKKEA